MNQFNSKGDKMLGYPKAPKPLKKPSEAWTDRKLELFEREDYECQRCSKALPYEELCAHHIKTRGAGGHDELSNLLCCCQDCHNKIHMGL